MYTVNHVVVILISFYLQTESSEVCIKARLTPASLLFKGLVSEMVNSKVQITNYVSA